MKIDGSKDWDNDKSVGAKVGTINIVMVESDVDAEVGSGDVEVVE